MTGLEPARDAGLIEVGVVHRPDTTQGSLGSSHSRRGRSGNTGATLGQPGAAATISGPSGFALGFSTGRKPRNTWMSPGVAPRVARSPFESKRRSGPEQRLQGQDRLRKWYPRPDSNRRYRLERAAC